MNVLMISPGFPAEQPFFTRGLAQVGAKVIGLGDTPQSALPEMAKESLAAYFQVASFADEGAILQKAREIAAQAPLHRVECLWEPYMILAARIREELGVPGMTVDETIPFRDKEIMKQVLDRQGIRTPRHAAATSVQGVRDAVGHVGYPLIVKPIDGAGSSDTYRIDDEAELEQVLPALKGVAEVSVEEFVEGDDYTFDCLVIDGRIVHHSICVYRPRALQSKESEWISPQTISLRDVDAPELQSGREMGVAVLKALGVKTAFTHMEWYRTASGEAVFGEIAARPPGAHTVDLMNYACDVDMFRGWAEATCHGTFSQRPERKWNAAWIFKRAQGQGRIQRIEGLGPILQEFGSSICVVDLLPIGAPRRNWKQTLISDGMVILRHPDLDTTLHMANRVSTHLQMFAG